MIPTPSGSEDTHTILYTVANLTEGDDSKKSPYLFRSLTASNLTLRLLENNQSAENCQWLPWTSSTSTRTNAHVIISTGSGTGLATAVWTQLLKPLLDCIELVEDTHYTLQYTTSETVVSELTTSLILPQANKGLATSVLLLSGDGGIVDVVNTLLSVETTESYKKPAITLLPLGTGNAMANSSGIAGDNTLGLRAMLRGSPREMPLFRASFSSGARLLVNQGQEEQPLQGVIDGTPVAYGAVVCSWGHHATLVADSDTTEYRKFGSERFKIAAKEALFPNDGTPPHAYRGRVSIRRPGGDDWEALSGNEHGYVLATIVSHLEAGFNISPSTKLLDGRLRLVHFGQLAGQEAMEVMGKAYRCGKHVEDERVDYQEIEGLRIEFHEEEARWRRVCLDGKIIRVEKGGWVEVRGGVNGVVDLISTES